MPRNQNHCNDGHARGSNSAPRIPPAPAHTAGDTKSINPVANSAGEAAWPTIPIPNDPALGGVGFFDQSIWLDPAANAAGLVTGWSSPRGIGTNRGGPGDFVSGTGRDATNPNGSVLPGEMPTFRLRY